MELSSRHRRRLTLLAVAALLVAVAFCLAAFQQPASIFSLLDQRLMHLAGQARVTPWTVAAVDLTAIGGYTILTLFIVLGTLYLLVIGLWREGLQLALTGTGADLLQIWLKHSYMRARPTLYPHLIVVDGFSFPSGHSLAAAAIFLCTGFLAQRLVAPERRGARFILLAVMVALAAAVGGTRVYLGVHWPTDVVGGLCLGWAWALTMEAAFNR